MSEQLNKEMEEEKNSWIFEQAEKVSLIISQYFNYQHLQLNL